MRKFFQLALVIILAGCADKVPDTYFTAEKASGYFREIEELCNRDNGALWGENLYGPVLFIDRTSRRIVANVPDAAGLLKEKGGVYTGDYPREQIILSAPVNYGGTTYAMVPLPAEEDPLRIKTRAIHVLFHCFQQRAGIQPVLFNQRNMDDKAARLYLKLEWKALRKAINEEGPERLVSIRDALVFRGASREIFQKFATEGNHFESYEGLATFTFTKLCAENNDSCRARLLRYLDIFYRMQSYARSYGVIHGALYTTLLHEGGYELKSIRSDSTNLARLVQELYGIELPEICRDVAGSLAFNYDLDIITSEEEKRLAAIKENLHQLTGTFTEKAVVYLELESPYFDFEPEDIHPADSLGTMYSSMRVSDNWGKLSVDKVGCLVSGNYKFMRVTAKGYKAERNRYSGEGWILLLNDGWEIVKVDQNYFLRRMRPL